ncbi:pyridoxamine 5'-phosphate oxidase family protein [Candidatus Parcubacteria bacterium]|nr:MAG: pyridoxamine 5'-phosphate oxidase family protein [Candidatus Parcubacteria bacterium]
MTLLFRPPRYFLCALCVFNGLILPLFSRKSCKGHLQSMTTMLDELQNQVVTCLAAHRVCIIGVASPDGGQAALVRYRSRGLEVDCLLPRWNDVAYYVERDPRVTLVIQETGERLRWLRCWGLAQILPNPDWTAWCLNSEAGVPPQDLYTVVHVVLWRVDLLDEELGWGVQKTWERSETDTA